MYTEDEYIVRKCLDGDKSAFNYLVDKYKGSVYAHAYSRLGNFQDAEDITQEVFITVYRKLHTLRYWDRIPAWLYSITSCLCRARIRSRRRQPDNEFIEDQNQDIVDKYSLDRYQDESISRTIDDALRSLSSIYREILILHYFGGMKVLDMAEYLGTSPRTIARRLRDARSHLRTELLEMVNAKLNEKKLTASFTIRISEIIKRIRIHPITPNALTWSTSITFGILLTIISIRSNQILTDYYDPPTHSPIPSQTKILKIGEIPVDVINISKKPFISSQKGVGDGESLQKPFTQDKSRFSIGNLGWIKRDDMPTRRAIVCSAVVGEKIFIFGGIDQGRTLTTVEEYDPITGKWSRKASMPIKRYSLSVSEVNGKIYVIGGWEAGVGFSAVEEYDPKTNRWTRKSDMPTPRSALSTSVVNGKIYAIGGNGGDYLPAPTLSTVEEYDPLTDTWTKKSDMPTSRGAFCTAVVNGKIYAIGGVTGIAGGGGPFVSIVEEYDPLKDTWTKKSARMPTPRSMFAVAVVNGKIYAIGGEARNKDILNIKKPLGTSIVEEYDPIKDIWTRKPDMPTPRCSLSAVAVNGKIYAFGGTDDLPFGKGFSTVEEFTPK